MAEKTVLIDLGKRIKNVRQVKELSQIGLAKSCNFEKATLSRIESGKSNPTVRTLVRIATALEIEVGELFQFAQS
jgi:transcriptional regulator with XRE-family HTH domain